MSTDRKSRAPIVACAIAAVAALAVGGYFLNHSMQCRALEEDYLNAFASLKSAGALRAIDQGKGELKAAAERIEADSLKTMEVAQTRIYEQCGQRAGETAFRKATELTVGSNF